MLVELEHCILNHVNNFKSKVRAVVLTGNGKHFTAGIDLKSAASIGMVGETNVSGDDGEEPDVARKTIQVTEHVLVLQR